MFFILEYSNCSCRKEGIEMKPNNENGYVLVLGIVILTALLILMGAMSNLISSDLSFFRSTRDRSKALYTAESGIAYGTEIFYDDNYRNKSGSIYSLKEEYKNKFNNLLNDSSLNNLEWTINSNQLSFTALGQSNGVSREINIIYDFNLLYNSVLDYMIATGGEIDIGNNQIPNGTNIISTVDMAEGSSFEDEDNNSIEVTVDSDFTVPSFDYDYLYSLVDQTITGNHIYDGEKVNNITHITGDLMIKQGDNNGNGGVNGSGVLIVDGNLYTENNSVVNIADEYENDYMIIIVRGDVNPDTNKNATLDMKGLLYAEGSVYFKNDFYLQGSIITKDSLYFKNDSNSNNLVYDPSFIEIFLSWGLKFIDDDFKNTFEFGEIIEWNEL